MDPALSSPKVPVQELAPVLELVRAQLRDPFASRHFHSGLRRVRRTGPSQRMSSVRALARALARVQVQVPERRSLAPCASRHSRSGHRLARRTGHCPRSRRCSMAVLGQARERERAPVPERAPDQARRPQLTSSPQSGPPPCSNLSNTQRPIPGRQTWLPLWDSRIRNSDLLRS